ncbi:MAG: PAS-domain containing protein [Pseudomonadota bacterium]
MTSTTAARHLLSLNAEREREDAIVSSLGEELRSRVEELRGGGEPFDATFQVASGRSVWAQARSVGLTTELRLVEDGGALERLRKAERALERERRELEALRRGLRLADVAVWTRAGHEGEAWIEQSESALPPLLQKSLIEASATDGPRRIESNDGLSGVFEVIRTSDEEDIIAARRIEDLARVERMMNRLLKTMSDTFAHLSVGLMIFDDRRRLSLFNPRILEIFGEDAKRLAARPRLEDMLDRWRAEGFLPERLDYPEWKAALCDLESIDDASIAEETWHIADGRSLRVLRRRHPSSGLAIVVEDVTESVSLRRSSASERAVRSLTTDMLNEGLAVTGPDGRFRMTNRAFRRLWATSDGEDFEPEHIKDFLPRRDLGAEAEGFWKGLLLVVTGGADPEALEQRMPLADRRVIQPRISPMPDGSTLTVFSDITAAEAMSVALRQRNEALEHADDMRAALVDQISHQMRTPLNSIYGFSQILVEERFGPLNDEQREYALAIIAGASDLTDVVDEMADLISIGGVSDEPERLNPMVVIRDVADAVSARFASRGASIDLAEVSVSGDMVVERLRFRQIVFNVFVDALTRTREGDVVEVSPSFEEGRLVLRISHPDAENAFDRGLAFALAQRAALLCDGELQTSSQPNGRRLLMVGVPLEPAEPPTVVHLAQAAAPI